MIIEAEAAKPKAGEIMHIEVGQSGDKLKQSCKEADVAGELAADSCADRRCRKSWSEHKH